MNSVSLILEGRTCLYVSLEPFLPVVTLMARPEVRGTIASAPLCFVKSLQTLADRRVLLLSDTVFLAGNWLPQARGEIWKSAPISCLYACPGSSTGSRQGISPGNDLHFLSHCKGSESSAIRSPCSTPTSSQQRTVQLLSWGSKSHFGPCYRVVLIFKWLYQSERDD